MESWLAESSIAGERSPPRAAPRPRRAVAVARGLVGVALALAALAAAAKEPYGTLGVAQVAAELGKPGVYLFDANPPEVYAKGHVPGARLVSYKVAASDLPADHSARLIFYCKNPH